MRYWLTSSTLPAFVFVGAMMGCTSEAKPNVKDAVARQSAPIRLAAKPPVAEETVVPPATIEKTKDIPAKQEFVVKKFEPADSVVKIPEGTETVTNQPVFVQPKDGKKDKGPKTPPKDKGDTSTDPKKDTTPSEPTEYQGRSFKEWLAKLKDADPTHREEAMKAILMFGPTKAAEAIPEILTQLEKHKKSALGVDLAVRVNGIMALSTIFRNGKDAPDGEILKHAFPLYKQFLKDEQIIMKVRALQGLPTLGPKAAELVDDVVALAHYPGTWEVRKEAIQTLTIIAQDGKGNLSKNAMVALRRRADKEYESSYLVRLTAYQGIAVHAQNKMPPELYNGLFDPEDKVKLTVLNLIGGVANLLDSKKLLKESDKAKIVGELETFIAAVEKTKDKDRILRIWAYAAIMVVKKECSKGDLGRVVGFLKEADPAVRIQAITVIGLGGEKAKPLAYNSIFSLMYDENLNVSGAAMGAIVSMHAVEAISELQKINKDEKANEVRRVTAAHAIDALEHNVNVMNEKKEKDKKTPDKK